ncbi:MAG: PilN domain-containing protein [Candidatus Cloacimonetes bacterium]|nr:PilN domain-containing protein [Candidatus Cloacimonadota bacterium]
MQQFYFKINLNKYGEQRIQQVRENKTFRNSVVFFVLGFIIVLAAWFYILQSSNTKVENRTQYLAETKAELDRYQTSGDYLSSNDLGRLARTFNNRIFWAKKMIALGQEIDDKLAVRKFSYANGILTINGITEVDANVKELDLINSFIQRLKANPEISNDFPDIKSGQIIRQIVKDTAIFEFVIECYTPEALRGGR